MIDLVDNGAFVGSSRQHCLFEAWRLFKRWCTIHGINCSMDRFNLERLGLKDNKKSRTKWSCLRTEAMNSRINVAWLDHFCTDRVNSNPESPEYMKLMASCLHHVAMFQYHLDVFPEFLNCQQRQSSTTRGTNMFFNIVTLLEE